MAPHAASSPNPDTSQPAASRRGFGLPHALVICVFVITATVLGALRIKEMTVQDILFLLGGSGSIGLSVVLAAVAGGNPNGPLRRALRAIFVAQG